MLRQISSAAATAVLSALAAALLFVGAFTIGAELTLEMDRDLPPRVAAGLYPPERAGLETFAWTAARADLTFAGLPRTSAWTCVVRVRGGRGEPLPQPQVDISIDGLRRATVLATNDYQDVEVAAPPRRQSGLTLSIASSTTVVPGPGDRRELGVQIARLACRPDESGLVWPPHRALMAAMAAAAALAVACVVTGVAPPAAIAAMVPLAAAQAWALSTGLAPYGDLPGAALRLALVLAILAVAIIALLERGTRRRLSAAARFVVLFSACVLYVKLLGLLHPSKLVIDALFHAHRFQTVLAGNYYFTQQMPGGVSFPYAIALYLFAAPWSYFTRDYVSLLRIVVSASEAVAGGLLYLLIVRTWGDRRVGVLAVILFHLVPLPYGLIGNANMTNAFGQSAALAAVVAAALFRANRGPQLAAVFALTAMAFLAHISTAALLGVTLLAAAALYRVWGDRRLHATAGALLAVTAGAALFAIVTYYGHFSEVYRTLDRVRPAAATAPLEAPPAGSDPQAAPLPTPLPTRAAHAVMLAIAVTGWPIVLLAGIGAWRCCLTRAADRLTLVLGAWGVAFVTFFCVGMLPRVDAQFERYAAEFVGRVVFATYPAVVVLAAAGSAWGLGAATLVPRLLAGSLLAWAGVTGIQQWSRWFTQ
jgi:hypothetical protein